MRAPIGSALRKGAGRSRQRQAPSYNVTCCSSPGSMQDLFTKGSISIGQLKRVFFRGSFAVTRCKIVLVLFIREVQKTEM